MPFCSSEISDQRTINQKTIKYLLSSILIENCLPETPEESQQFPNLQTRADLVVKAIQTAANNIGNNLVIRCIALDETSSLSSHENFSSFYNALYAAAQTELLNAARNNPEYQHYLIKVLSYLTDHSTHVRRHLEARLFINLAHSNFFTTDTFPIVDLIKRSDLIAGGLFTAALYHMFINSSTSLVQLGATAANTLMVTPLMLFMEYPKERHKYNSQYSYNVDIPKFSYGIEDFADFSEDHPMWQDKTWKKFFQETWSPDFSWWYIGLCSVFNFTIGGLLAAIIANHDEDPSNSTELNPLPFYITIAMLIAHCIYTAAMIHSPPSIAAIEDLESSEAKERFQAIDRSFTRLRLAANIPPQPITMPAFTSGQASAVNDITSACVSYVRASRQNAEASHDYSIHEARENPNQRRIAAMVHGDEFNQAYQNFLAMQPSSTATQAIHRPQPCPPEQLLSRIMQERARHEGQQPVDLEQGNGDIPIQLIGNPRANMS